MRDQTFAEFDGVAGGKMRPLRAVKARELRKILEINSGRGRVSYDSIPNLTARRRAIFENFQPARNQPPNENDFAAAGPKFLRCCGHVLETLFDRLLHLRQEGF